MGYFIDSLGIKPGMTDQEKDAAEIEVALELARKSEEAISDLADLDKEMLESITGGNFRGNGNDGKVDVDVGEGAVEAP